MILLPQISLSYPDFQPIISIKKFGNFKLTQEKLTNPLFIKQLQNFLSTHNCNYKNTVFADLQNTNNVTIIKTLSPNFIINTDALITANNNIKLAITIADCLPIYLYHPDNHLRALIHAGWKGLHQNIIQNTLKLIKQNYLLDFSKFIVILGPSISSKNYQVQTDFKKIFGDHQNAFSEQNNKTYFDISIVATNILTAFNITNIYQSSLCTYQNYDLFFSYRRDKPQNVQTMLAVI